MNGNNIISFEHAKIINIGSFKNFEGKGSEKNNAGNRYFNLIIDSEEQALAMLDDGWNIKKYVPANPDHPVQYHVQVAVSYKFPRLAPQIYLVEPGPNGENRVSELTERSVKLLDNRNVLFVDGAIRGREYEPGKIKAYCVELWCNVEPKSKFAEKYGYYGNNVVEDGDDEEMPF